MDQKLKDMRDNVYRLEDTAEHHVFLEALIEYRNALFPYVDDDMDWMDDEDLAFSIFDYYNRYYHDDSWFSSKIRHSGIFSRGDVSMYGIWGNEHAPLSISIDTYTSGSTKWGHWDNEKLWRDIQLYFERLRSLGQNPSITIAIKYWIDMEPNPYREILSVHSPRVGEWELSYGSGAAFRQESTFEDIIEIVKNKSFG